MKYERDIIFEQDFVRKLHFSRSDINEVNSRLFVSFDLKPEEQNEIKNLNISQKTFDLDLSDLFEGDKSIIIT
jgi:hypothetical protein